jgi:hypothetical protein
VSQSDFIFGAVGDLMLFRDNPKTMFRHTRDFLRSTDITFGQLEVPHSDKGTLGSSGPRGAVPKDPKMLPAIVDAGFDVLSIASNHTLDWGADALLDCIEHLRSEGVAVVGGGANIAEARKPAILERKGTKIAVLGYCSVAPSGYYAARNKPGIAPMRAITHYHAFEEDQPGTPCEIMSFPVRSDLDALVSDVKAAKEITDIVVLSMHWGVHNRRVVIADYQPVVAHAAIDAGADIIIGHHPHILKGIEVYKGKVIFYSLGNFAIDAFTPKVFETFNVDWWHERAKVYDMPVPGSEGHYTYREEQRKTIAVKCHIADGKIAKVTFIPSMINAANEPVLYDTNSPEGAEVLKYIKDITAGANLDATFALEGSEILVTG